MSAERLDFTKIGFGEYVRAKRKLINISQNTLAELAGISQSYIREIELRGRIPDDHIVLSIARALGDNPEALMLWCRRLKSQTDEVKDIYQRWGRAANVQILNG